MPPVVDPWARPGPMEARLPSLQGEGCPRGVSRRRRSRARVESGAGQPPYGASCGSSMAAHVHVGIDGGRPCWRRSAAAPCARTWMHPRPLLPSTAIPGGGPLSHAQRMLPCAEAALEPYSPLCCRRAQSHTRGVTGTQGKPRVSLKRASNTQVPCPALDREQTGAETQERAALSTHSGRRGPKHTGIRSHHASACTAPHSRARKTARALFLATFCCRVTEGAM
jgi:hypothetical protein